MTTPFINPNIFRAYDIRGVAETDLPDDVVTAIGQAFGTSLRRRGEQRATIGRDNRASSERIFAALARGVTSTGIDVVDLGLVSTPVFYFSRAHLGIPSGVMITGSHLPPAENGFKMVAGGEVLTDRETTVLQRMIAEGDLDEGSGSITQADIIPDYVRTVAGLTRLARPLKVVVDSGNGMAGGIAPQVFRTIGAEVVELFSESDPTFPNHFPDPTIPAYMHDLQERVRSTGADLGVAFDADADRLGVVDPTGRIVWGDMLLALLFREVAATHQGEPVIVEVKCSQATYEDVAAHGGKPLFWKTGHAFIEAKMHETHAVVAGEMSGHLYFGDEYQPYDDGIYAGARVARMVAAGTLPLDALVDDLPRYEATPELRVHCPDETKFSVIDDVVQELGARYPGSFTLDGIRVAFPHGWALARCSNTSPRIIVRAEGRTPAERDEYLRIIRDELAKHDDVDITALDQCLAGEEVTKH